MTRARAHAFDARGRRSQTAAVSAALLLGAATALTGAGQGLEHGMQALRAGLHPRAASGKVALVEIDARSLADQPRWPWPRSLYGRAVDALGHAGASLAAFDIDVSAASTPEQDRAFADALARAPLLVALPTFAQASSSGSERRLENAAIPRLREHAALAAVNVEADADGVVRRYPYGVTTGGVPRPSMAAMLAGATGASGRSFVVDAAIDPATIPRFSFEDVAAGRVPAGALKGRNVLIGATAIELGDRFPTPSHGVLPGVLVQALAAETLIQHRDVAELGPLLPLVAAAAGLLLLRRLQGGTRTAALLALAGALLAAPFATEVLRGPSVEVVPALASVAAAGLLLAALSASAGLRRARLLDPASGLPNGRALAEALVRDAPGGGVLALRIRDRSDLLSVVGEQGLARVVAKLAERLRFSASAEVHRIDADALAWRAPPGLDEDELRRLADSLAAVVRPAVELDGRFLDMACAFGFAGPERGPEQAVANSLLAAGRALERNVRLELHRDGWREESEVRLSLAADFDRALAQGDVWIAYQPKLDIASGEITGVEALARWRHPERGALSPDLFIPLVEAGGRMPELTLHVVACVLRDLALWTEQGLEITAAVNISALLPADAGFMADLSALLAASPVAPSRLTAEVTESAALADPERAALALGALAELGVRVSIDDYGAGQSTLSYLKVLPASEIKIDRGFVTHLTSSRGDQAMVRSSIDLGHQLGMKVVAEGVETVEQLDLLRAYGCDTAQGWLIGRPVPADELRLRLAPRLAA